MRGNQFGTSDEDHFVGPERAHGEIGILQWWLAYPHSDVEALVNDVDASIGGVECDTHSRMLSEEAREDMGDARGGKIIKGLQDVFPDQKPIDRTYINAWQDKRIVDLVKRTGRRKLILAALWTEMCLAMPTIHALGEGYDVYIVTDASGGVSVETHEMAVRRMVQAGAVPITWIGLSGEWQRDWARVSTLADAAKILVEHGGGSGVAFAWETQLLAASKL